MSEISTRPLNNIFFSVRTIDRDDIDKTFTRKIVYDIFGPTGGIFISSEKPGGTDISTWIDETVRASDIFFIFLTESYITALDPGWIENDKLHLDANTQNSNEDDTGFEYIRKKKDGLVQPIFLCLQAKAWWGRKKGQFSSKPDVHPIELVDKNGEPIEPRQADLLKQLRQLKALYCKQKAPELVEPSSKPPIDSKWPFLLLGSLYEDTNEQVRQTVGEAECLLREKTSAAGRDVVRLPPDGWASALAADGRSSDDIQDVRALICGGAHVIYCVDYGEGEYIAAGALDIASAIADATDLPRSAVDTSPMSTVDGRSPATARLHPSRLTIWRPPCVLPASAPAGAGRFGRLAANVRPSPDNAMNYSADGHAELVRGLLARGYAYDTPVVYQDQPEVADSVDDMLSELMRRSLQRAPDLVPIKSMDPGGGRNWTQLKYHLAGSHGKSIIVADDFSYLDGDLDELYRSLTDWNSAINEICPESAQIKPFRITIIANIDTAKQQTRLSRGESGKWHVLVVERIDDKLEPTESTEEYVRKALEDWNRRSRGPVVAEAG